MHMSHQQRDKNYYEILEIQPGATPDEVYDGYVRAKNAYSGDSLALYSLMSKDECNQLLGLIEEAYTIISDPTKRMAYDKARGINSGNHNAPNGNNRNSQINLNVLKSQKERDFSAEEAERQSPNLTKLVAANKYTLSFEKDVEFEKLIEQTNEYSGEFLKRIREYKSVPLDRMSEMTKVSKNYLNAIEAEKWQSLPAMVYVRGFVYQYAKCLKLNPDLVASNYLHRLTKIKGKG